MWTFCVFEFNIISSLEPATEMNWLAKQMIVSPRCAYNLKYCRLAPPPPRAGPQLFPCCLSNGLDAPLNRWVFLTNNCTLILQWIARLQHDSKDSVTDTSINHNNYMKLLDHCLWLCRMARTTGYFPGITGFYPMGKSGEFRLAHKAKMHKDLWAIHPELRKQIARGEWPVPCVKQHPIPITNWHGTAGKRCSDSFQVSSESFLTSAIVKFVSSKSFLTSVSVKFEQIPLFYPCGWAAPLRGIGKLCCLFLVLVSYIGPRPRARPRGVGELLKLLRGTGQSQS